MANCYILVGNIICYSIQNRDKFIELKGLDLLKKLCEKKKKPCYEWCVKALGQVAFFVPLLDSELMIYCLSLMCEILKKKSEIHDRKVIRSFLNSIYNLFYENFLEQ